MSQQHHPTLQPLCLAAAVAAVAAASASATYRIRMQDLGRPDAQPVPLDEYHRLRDAAIAQGRAGA